MSKQIGSISSNYLSDEEVIQVKFRNEQLEKENSLLIKELRESRGMSWILSQVIKVCGTLDSFSNLMNQITDILMGILGLDTCTVWIKAENDYVSYSRSVYNGNKYEIKEYEYLPDYLLKLKNTSSFDISHKKITFCKGENVESIVIAPLHDFRADVRIGAIIIEHRSKNFFTKNTIDFFDLLAIQISIVAINSKLFEKVNEVSNRDVLTNCYNRNYLEKLMLDMNTDKNNYTLAVFDLDNFKSVNDIYGHEKGDEFLVTVSNLAIDMVKEHKGNVIRYGGDEFIIILFKPLNEALDILRFFREKVPELEVIKRTKLNVTATIGVASYPETVSTMQDIFTIADMALVDGKSIGLKNRIHIGYDEIMQSSFRDR